MPQDQLLATLQAATAERWAEFEGRALALYPIEEWRTPWLASPVPRLIHILQYVWPWPPREYHPELLRAMDLGSDARIAAHDVGAGEAAGLAAGLTVMSEHLAWAIGTKDADLGTFAVSLVEPLAKLFA